MSSTFIRIPCGRGWFWKQRNIHIRPQLRYRGLSARPLLDSNAAEGPLFHMHQTHARNRERVRYPLLELMCTRIYARLTIRGVSGLGRSLLFIFFIACLSCLAAGQNVDEIIAKCIDARGGLKKIKSVQSERLTGH